MYAKVIGGCRRHHHVLNWTHLLIVRGEGADLKETWSPLAELLRHYEGNNLENDTWR